MERSEEEFFTHLREVLFEYELDYKQGAWERFQNKEREKKYALWIQWFRPVAAAAIIFFGMLIWRQSLPESEQKQFYTSKISKKYKMDQLGMEPINLRVASKKAVIPKRAIKLIGLGNTKIVSPHGIDTMKMELTSVTMLSIQKIKDSSEHKYNKNNPISEKLYPQRNKELEYALNNDYKSNSEEDETWKLNVSLSSDCGPTRKLQLGFGSSVEYALNKRLSLSAGAAYIQISGLDKLELMSSTETNKSPISVETSVKGIDLPVELKYGLNKHSYFSVGISILGILGKSQTFNYKEIKLMEVTVNGDEGPIIENKFVVFTESIPVASEALPKQNYMGFYNFSYGFMQKIWKNNQLVFEPYIKLPMNTYSDQHSNLISTGVRIKMRF